MMWANDVDTAAYARAPGPPRSGHRRAHRARAARPVTSDPSGRGRILGIETSCDETAAAVVERGTSVLSSVVSSQVDLHARYGGVVPEIASRAHVDLIVPVVAQAFVEAGLSEVPADGEPQIDAVAATYGPGLVGALLVGVSAAKALALAWDVPFLAVNHLEAHLYAHAPGGARPRAAAGRAPRVRGPHDDRAHGGPRSVPRARVDHRRRRRGGLRQGRPLPRPRATPADRPSTRLSVQGDPEAIRFPRPMAGDGTYDFSFSGLKTAVVNHVRKHPEVATADVAASFQEAVVDVLVTKTQAAAREVGAKGLCLGGGVAANSRLRERFLDACVADGIRGFLPSRAMCTDNAAMVASAAWYRWQSDGPSPLDTGAHPNLGIPVA